MENLTTDSFKEKIFDFTENQEWTFKGDKPAVIDFYADWCGPCKTIAPILEELDAEYEGIDFYKIDTEKEVELSRVFGIQSIPSILFVPADGLPQMALGALPKETFKQAVSEILLAEKSDEVAPEADEKTEDKPE